MELTYVSQSPMRHTYPFGAHDVTLPFTTAAELRASIATVFRTDAQCRRVVVAVDQDDTDSIAVGESAGLRYVLDVHLRDGRDVSLLVAEPDWVTSQSTDVKDLQLS